MASGLPELTNDHQLLLLVLSGAFDTILHLTSIYCMLCALFWSPTYQLNRQDSRPHRTSCLVGNPDK